MYNVCSGHRGDVMSTKEGYLEYIGGCTFCTSEGYHVRGYHEYIGGFSAHRMDIMSTSGDIAIHVGS